MWNAHCRRCMYFPICTSEIRISVPSRRKQRNFRLFKPILFIYSSFPSKFFNSFNCTFPYLHGMKNVSGFSATTIREDEAAIETIWLARLYPPRKFFHPTAYFVPIDRFLPFSCLPSFVLKIFMDLGVISQWAKYASPFSDKPASIIHCVSLFLQLLADKLAFLVVLTFSSDLNFRPLFLSAKGRINVILSNNYSFHWPVGCLFFGKWKKEGEANTQQGEAKFWLRATQWRALGSIWVRQRCGYFCLSFTVAKLSH